MPKDAAERLQNQLRQECGLRRAIPTCSFVQRRDRKHQAISAGGRVAGDLAYYDETGRVHFVERLKEMIKCMDNQVAPAEIEELITSSCPGVDKVGVVGLPHPDYGEVATAFVALKPGCHVTEKDIKKIVAGFVANTSHAPERRWRVLGLVCFATPIDFC
ncbi:hypothetical protein V5799_016062 [Amblyomma americanum]|uniref:AMP-binding enzyme C-terminal domain-containing protein n=1 Tax=Amblyomma americanum TaxID=6943 RepID=A0AAQ4F634_AMBAM